MQRKEVTNLIKYYGSLMGSKNFTPGTSGNISHRYNGNILITTSGSANGYLNDEEVILMDYDGNSLDDNWRTPSSEKLMHIEIYKQRSDINAIIHVHSPYLSSFAASGIALDKPILSEYTFYFGKIPVAEYALSSTLELAEKTAKHFKEYNAVLMANHGFVIGGKDIKEAYLKLELAESYAQVVLNTYILGGGKKLNSKQEEELLKLRNKNN